MSSVGVMELLVIRCYLAHHYIATEEMSVSDSLDNYPAYLGRVFLSSAIRQKCAKIHA